jgi:hypothetical protein
MGPELGSLGLYKKGYKKNTKYPTPHHVPKRDLNSGKIKEPFILNGNMFDTKHPSIYDPDNKILYCLSSKKDSRWTSFPQKSRVSFFSSDRNQMSYGTRSQVEVDFVTAKKLREKTEIQLAFEKQDKHFDWSF